LKYKVFKKKHVGGLQRMFLATSIGVSLALTAGEVEQLKA